MISTEVSKISLELPLAKHFSLIFSPFFHIVNTSISSLLVILSIEVSFIALYFRVKKIRKKIPKREINDKRDLELAEMMLFFFQASVSVGKLGAFVLK